MVRMGIDIADPSVCSPSGMTDAAVGAVRNRREGFPKIGYFSCLFHYMDLGTTVKICNTGAVVSAVFQLGQSVQQNGSGLQGAAVSDNSAHDLFILRSF
jgi:hypothetical protein